MRADTLFTLVGPSVVLWSGTLLFGGGDGKLPLGIAFVLVAPIFLLASCVSYVVAVWPAWSLTLGVGNRYFRGVCFVSLSVAIGFVVGFPLNMYVHTSVLVFTQSLCKLGAHVVEMRRESAISSTPLSKDDA